MPYRFLEHTADVRVECTAETFECLLQEAAAAFYAVALRRRRDDHTAERQVHVNGETREELLVRWLQELLYLLETERFVASRFDVAPGLAGAVSAHLHGYDCPPKDRETEIKAATYHGMDVRITPEGYAAEIIFDL